MKVLSIVNRYESILVMTKFFQERIKLYKYNLHSGAM